MRCILTAVGIAVLQVVCAFTSEIAAAKVQQAPSSRVAIDVPDSYAVARQFTGFVDEAAGVSLVIVELPDQAYEQLAAGLSSEALATKGITGVEAGKINRSEPYLYRRGVQASAQGPVVKLLLAFKNSGVTALITANVQQASIEKGLVTTADVERVLATAGIAAAAAPSRDVFRLGYLGPFKPAGSVLGTTRVYTLDGKMEPGAPAEFRPVLIVAPSLDRRPVLEPQKQADVLLAGLPGVEAPRIEDRRNLRISDMDAIELTATATDKSSGHEIAVWQLIVLPAGGGHFRLVSQMPVAEKERLLPELRKIADGFRPVE